MNKTINKLIGILMILTGMCLAFYVGFWICAIGGFVDVINEIKSVETSAFNVAVGILKIAFSSLIGYISGAILFVPGFYMIRG